MSQKYEVILMSPEEMKNAHKKYGGRYKNTEDSLGFYDPQHNRIGVINTKSHELNKMLLEHEWDHVIEKHATDEDEHGLRHKKFFKQILLPAVAPAIAPFVNKGFKEGLKDIPGIFGAAGAGFLTGGPVGAGVGASAASLRAASDPNRTFNNTGEILGQTGIGAASGIGAGALGAPGASSAPLNIFGGGAGAAKAGASQSTSGGGGVSSVLSKFNLGNIFGGGTPPIVPPGGGGVSALPGISGGSGISFGKLATGLGSLALGQFGGPKTPEVPDFSQIPSIANLRNTAGQPLSDIGKLGTERLTERLNQTRPELDPAIQSNIKRVFDEERNQITSQFKLYRPGANLAEDSAFRQSMSDLDQRESESLAQAQQQENVRFSQQQTQDIAQSLGVDTQTLQTLTNLAQLDIDQIMLQTGMDAQKSQEFKQQFGRLGELFISSGLGLAA